MKKIFTFLSLIALFAPAFSQQKHFNAVLNTQVLLNTEEQFLSHGEQTSERAISLVEAFGTPIISEDFTDATHWLMQNNAGGAKMWAIGTSTDADAAQLSTYTYGFNMWNPDPTSTNKFAYFNAVNYLITQSVPVVIDVTLEYNGILNFSSYTGVGIQWNQNYKAFNQDKIYLEYSVDGGSSWFASGGDELYFPIQSNFYAPTYKYINLSHELGGQSNVKIRFRWSCNYTGSSVNSSGGGYGWMIDNVTVLGLDNNDLMTEKILPRFFGLGNYTKFPYKHRQKLTEVKAIVLNNGGTVQNDIFTYANIFEPGNSTPVLSVLSTMPYSILAVGDRDTAATDTFSYVPPASLGNYIISCRNEQTQTENHPLDNIDTISFSVTDTVFARDRTYTGLFGPTSVSGSGDGDYSTISYYVTTEDTIRSVSVFIAAGTKVNSIMQGILCYHESGNLMSEQIVTPNYTILAADIGKWITLSFRSSYNQFSEVLNAGTLYFVGVKYFWKTIAPTTKGMYIGTDKNSHMAFDDWGGGSNYYVKADGTIFGHLLEVPKIRMNTAYPAELVGTISVAIDADPALFPNPSTGIFNFTHKGISSIRVYDLMGRIVYESNSLNNQINLTELTQGYYFVKITARNRNYIQKISIVR